MKHLDYPDLCVQLRVAGQALNEYDVEEGGDLPSHVAEKFVEAAQGTSFAIYIEAPFNMARNQLDLLKCTVYVDGQYATNGMLLGDTTRNVDTDKLTLEGVVTNVGQGRTLKRFMFAGLETNDGAVGTAKKEDFHELGEVTVGFTWVRKDRPVAPMFVEPISTTDVPEKCLKGRAISTRTTLGAAEYLSGQVQSWAITYPYDKDAFAEYTFKYRTRRDLQIEGVIPRSPSPLPLEERVPEDLTAEEARELVRRLRKTRVKQMPVKLEKREWEQTVIVGDEDSDGLEVIAGPSKRRRTTDEADVEVIDLTDD